MTTTSSYTSFATELLAALEQFDRKIAPQGLYAAEEHGVKEPLQRWELEWKSGLMPFLKTAGATFASKGRLERQPYPFDHVPAAARASFILPNLGQIQLTLVRISKIKVRIYGNAYRTDPYHDFSHRWSKLQLATYLKRARQYQPTQSRVHPMLLLIGFDSILEPLRKELTVLHQVERNWENFGWSLHSLNWADPHQRGFFTRAALWTPQDHDFMNNNILEYPFPASAS